MYLHEDKENFRDIVEQVADRTGRTMAVIEKDYYVTLILKLLSLERTYIDKIFALCDYYMQGRNKRCSRHLYDIYKLTPQMKFDDDFAKLYAEVRIHRAKMSICPSAQPGVNVAKLINEFCDNGYYEDDCHTITNYFADDMVEYADAIKQMRNLAELEIITAAEV